MEEKEKSKKELIVLIKYLVQHNKSHSKELLDLASDLKSINLESYSKVIESIKSYEDGNQKLLDALNLLEKE